MAKRTGGLGVDAIFSRATQPKVEAAKEQESRASNVTLPVEVWEWIDSKHAESRRDGGKALRKAAIFRAVFELAMSIDVDLSGVQSEEEIIERFQVALAQKYK